MQLRLACSTSQTKLIECRQTGRMGAKRANLQIHMRPEILVTLHRSSSGSDSKRVIIKKRVGEVKSKFVQGSAVFVLAVSMLAKLASGC